MLRVVEALQIFFVTALTIINFDFMGSGKSSPEAQHSQRRARAGAPVRSWPGVRNRENDSTNLLGGIVRRRSDRDEEIQYRSNFVESVPWSCSKLSTLRVKASLFAKNQYI